MSHRPQCVCRGLATVSTLSGELSETLCLLQGAQYLFDHYISPGLKHHAAKLDPVFASTNTVSQPYIRQCHYQSFVLRMAYGSSHIRLQALRCTAGTATPADALHAHFGVSR